MTDKYRKFGYWSIVANKHLSAYRPDSPNLDELETLNYAGKVGRFIGLIRGNTKIEQVRKLEKQAALIGINHRELLQNVLPDLRKITEGKIDFVMDNHGQLLGVEEYVTDSNEVINDTGKIFEYLGPREIEKSLTDSLYLTKAIPQSDDELHEQLSKFYTEETIDLALPIGQSFRLLKKNMTSRNVLYSNEYLWGGKQKKILYSLEDLDFGSKDELVHLINTIASNQGSSYEIEENKIKNKKILDLATRTGLVIPIKFVTQRKLDKTFLFTSNLLNGYNVNDDILDDVKILISAITFGKNYTNYSQLRDPINFLQKLVSGDTVGPHSANKTDYVLLEKRNIVKVWPSVPHPERYFMKLLKKDVGQLALTIISDDSQNYTIENDIKSTDFSLNSTNQIVTPEEFRMEMGKASAEVEEAEVHLLRVLRGEDLN